MNKMEYDKTNLIHMAVLGFCLNDLTKNWQ